MNKSWTRVISWLALGGLLSYLVLFPITAKRIQTLQLQEQKMQLQLEEAQKEITRYQKDLLNLHKRQSQGLTIQKLSMKVQGVSATEEVQLEKKMIPLLGDLIGTPVSQIHPLLLYNLWNGRLITTNSGTYLLNVKVIALSQTLAIYVSAKKQKGF